MPQGATLDELARGIHGAVTREDAKKLAKLHGHKWKALLKRMKRLSLDIDTAQRRYIAALTQRAEGTTVPGTPTPLDRIIEGMRDGS